MFTFSAKASASPKGWRSGWISLKNKEQCEKLIEAAKEIYFNALIANGSIENMKMFSDMAHANGLESYYWLSPVYPKGGEAKQYLQKLRPCDEAAYQEQRKWQQNMENGYQGGGEPLEGRTEYNFNPAPCTHNEAVMEATNRSIA